MKTISASLKAHLAQEVTTLCTCWEVHRKDGVVLRFTDHDKDLVVSGETYVASSGYMRTAVEQQSTGAVDNLDITGILASEAIDPDELRAGLFDYAEMKMFVVNWRDTSQGILKLHRGRLGEVTLTPSGMFRAELRGLGQNLSQNIGEVFQPECRADLGDSRCKFPLLPPTILSNKAYSLGSFVRVECSPDPLAENQARYFDRIFECTTAGTTGAAPVPSFDATLEAETTWGTAVFTSRLSFVRHGVVAANPGRKVFALQEGFSPDGLLPDGWFDYGAVKFETGRNVGSAIEIKQWRGLEREVTLFLEAPFTPEEGDQVILFPGCDKRLETCASKFSISGSSSFPSARGNVWNFRGEPHVPGADELLWYPDAK